MSFKVSIYIHDEDSNEFIRVTSTHDLGKARQVLKDKAGQCFKLLVG